MENLVETIKTWPKEKQDSTYFIAMDEVGRGSLFGPVTVGGIAFSSSELLEKPEREWNHKIRDSKKLSPIKRRDLSEKILQEYNSHVSHVSVNFINKYNINKAIQYGVYRISSALKKKILKENPKAEIFMILLDGNYKFQFPQIRMKNILPPIKSIIKGDDLVFHISCASIIAKESRDNLLKKSSDRFPHFHLEKNAGYGTLSHRLAIKEHGPSRFHRKEYVKKIASL